MCGLWLLHALGSAAGADCKGQNLKGVTVVPASVVRPQGSRPHYGRWCGSRNGGYGISGGSCGRHAGLRPANFHSLVHFATSSARNLPNSMGEVEKVLPPKSAYFALISCLCSPVLISLFSRSMIADGVFLGAPIPAHELISYPGRNSATAGTSGIAGEREAPVIAKARS